MQRLIRRLLGEVKGPKEEEEQSEGEADILFRNPILEESPSAIPVQR